MCGGRARWQSFLRKKSTVPFWTESPGQNCGHLLLPPRSTRRTRSWGHTPMALRAKSNWGEAGRSSWASLTETPKLPSASPPFASCISGSFQWWLRVLSHLLARDTCEKPLSLTARRPLSSSVQVRKGCGLPSLYFLHSPDPVTAPPQPHIFITLFRDFQNPQWDLDGPAQGLHSFTLFLSGWLVLTESQFPLYSLCLGISHLLSPCPFLSSPLSIP